MWFSPDDGSSRGTAMSWIGRRQGNADGLEHGAGAAGGGGTQAKPPSGLIDVGLHNPIDVANDIGPFEVHSVNCYSQTTLTHL
jgi:hypothetical protein